ncbi:MAG: substrate-binding domain-containing protein [Pseudomonadota bacterium]|nr:substrate-binding domain-containing protein [Pseudomonadota bacterium]
MTPEHTITVFHGLPGPAVGQPISGRTGYLTSLPARMIGILAAILAVMALLAVKAPAGAAEAIIVQSTTSTQNAGFYRHVLPAFTAESGITVKVVAVGTGQALKNAQNCDGDMLIVHARTAEEAFIDAGYGAARYNLMYNDFIIVGPQRDPAGLRYAADAREAMRRIQRAGARFASRGDESGTHKKEQDLWRAIGTNPEALPGSWYLETGSGMGATLNFSVQSDSHALTDRATWLSFANKFRHRILFEGDPRLFNQYGIVTLDPGHCPTANHEGAMRLADWLLSPDGQERIGSLTRKGEQLFIPNAGTR